MLHQEYQGLKKNRSSALKNYELKYKGLIAMTPFDSPGVSLGNIFPCRSSRLMTLKVDNDWIADNTKLGPRVPLPQLSNLKKFSCNQVMKQDHDLDQNQYHQKLPPDKSSEDSATNSESNWRQDSCECSFDRHVTIHLQNRGTWWNLYALSQHFKK